MMGWMTKTQNSLRNIARRLCEDEEDAAAYPVGEALKNIEEAKTRLYAQKRDR